jgi:hypothetical protein
LGDDVDVGVGLGEVVADDGSAWHTVSVAGVAARLVNEAAWAVPSTPRARKPPLNKLTAATRTCAKRIRIARLRCSAGSARSPRDLRAHREFGGD